MTDTSKSIDWDAMPLGWLPDTELARRLGVDASTVRHARKRRGIHAHRPRRKVSRATCTRCGEEKRSSEFHRDRTKKGGIVCVCKACLSKRPPRFSVSMGASYRPKVGAVARQLNLSASATLELLIDNAHYVLMESRDA